MKGSEVDPYYTHSASKQLPISHKEYYAMNPPYWKKLRLVPLPIILSVRKH